MIHKLQDGDEVIILPNLLKDGTVGEMFTRVSYVWYTKHNKVLLEDPKNKIFPKLMDLYWVNRKNNGPEIIIAYQKFYCYALVNWEYKIIKLGYIIYNKIMEDADNIRNYNILKIKIKKSHGYDNYEDTHYTSQRSDKSVLTKDMLKSKTMYIEDIDKHLIWTNNTEVVINIFKDFNADIATISELKQYFRRLKLNRIL